MAVTFEKGEGSRSSDSKKPAYGMRELSQYPVLQPFPYDSKKAIALLDRWVKDRITTLPKVHYLPSPKDQKDERNDPYHRRIGHPFEQCITFTQTFDEKHKAREVLLQQNKGININERPLPEH